MDEVVPPPVAAPSTPPPRSSTDHDDDGDKTVVEYVDVYLLAPEEDRDIELKDFTIMKPKNNKMFRLVRYYPRCEISYRAVPPPPPEEKVVTSPNGTNTTTITTTHRHNGGFSNPGRNTEVFKLKRRLLKEYYASIKKDPTFLSMDDDALDARPYSAGHASLRSTYRRPASPPTWATSEGGASSPVPSLPSSTLARYPKYKRIALGDEDTVPLTSELQSGRMSWSARINYVSSLWPEIAPVDGDDEIMDYYGLEVQIITEEERKQELEADAQRHKDVNGEVTSEESKGEQVSPTAKNKKEENNGNEEEANDEEEDDDETPEMTVETRSAAKMKGEPTKMSPTATKQDDWVQCDKCQKWRRLPNHVNVSELPASWYCKMNRWDKRFNKCSVPEEKVVVPMKESDLVEFRERKFVLDFVQRIKRMEKAVQQYKFTDPREDHGDREVVQCVECFKTRPLIGGMDPRKIAQPFVCWMNNWDELHASCSAPQGAIPSRHYELASGHDDDGSGSVSTSKKAGSSSAGGGAGGVSASSSSKKSASKPSSSSGTSGNSQTKSAKRRPSETSASATTTTSSANTSSSSNAKRPKRR